MGRIADYIKSIGNPRAKDEKIPQYQDMNGKDISESGLTNEMIHKHRDAIRNGNIPQEIRDLGIEHIEIVDNNPFNRMKDSFDSIRNRLSQNKDEKIPQYKDINGKDISETGLTNEMIHKHRDAIRNGNIPQEIRDLGIEHIEIVDNNPFDRMKDSLNSIRNRFSRTANEPAEDLNVAGDMPEPEPSGLGSEMTGASETESEFNKYTSMTDDAFAALPYEERVRAMNEHTVTNDNDIGAKEYNESILERARYADVDMGDGTMARAKYSPEDMEIIENRLRENGVLKDESIQLSESDIDDLGFSNSQSVESNAGNTNAENTSSVQLSASDISDLNTTEHSHQL